MRQILHWVLLLVVLVGGVLPLANAAEPVGTLAFVRGEVNKLTPDGVTRTAEKGTPVFNGERIESGARTTVMILFNDNTRFTLGSNASFRIDRVEAGDGGGFSAEVLRGAFRFVTGLIAKQKPSSMQIKMGVVATIGIRGTTVGGEVVGESATVVLLEPEDGAEASAVEVGNEHGSVVLSETGTGTRVPDANSPPTPPERMRLRAVDNLVRNLNSLQRNLAPRPSIR